MEFVNNDKPYLPEIGSQRSLLQENLERFRGDHQEMGGFAFFPRSFPPGNIAMPFHNRKGRGSAEGPEPLLLVIDKCLQGREIETGNPRPAMFHEIVHHGDQGGLGLSPCRGGDNKRVVSRPYRTAGIFLYLPEFRPVKPLGKHLLEGFVQG